MRCAGFSPICQVHFAGFQILPRTAARGACLRLIARCRKRAIKNLRLQLHVSQKRAVAKMRLSQHPWWRSTMAHRDRGTLHVVPSLVAALGGAVLPPLPAATRVPALRRLCNNPVAVLEQMAAQSAQLARLPVILDLLCGLQSFAEILAAATAASCKCTPLLHQPCTALQAASCNHRSRARMTINIY